MWQSISILISAIRLQVDFIIGQSNKCSSVTYTIINAHQCLLFNYVSTSNPANNVTLKKNIDRFSRKIIGGRTTLFDQQKVMRKMAGRSDNRVLGICRLLKRTKYASKICEQNVY